jgi:hypothetical protein
MPASLQSSLPPCPAKDWSAVVAPPKRRCADLRPLHDDEAGGLKVLDEALRGGCCHVSTADFDLWVEADTIEAMNGHC